MTAVLSATDPAWGAVLDGSPILPVEGRRCHVCRDWPDSSICSGPCRGRGVLPPDLSGRFAIAVDGAIVGTATAEEVLPVLSYLSPEWAEFVTANEEHRFIDCTVGNKFLPPHAHGLFLRISEREGATTIVSRSVDLSHLLPALDLRPGGWVVAVSDVAPAERCPFGHDKPPAFRAEDIDSDAPLDGTRLAADIAATVPEANREVRRAEWRAELKARTRARRKCRFCMFGEPVPVAAAPVGTVTTWEAR